MAKQIDKGKPAMGRLLRVENLKRKPAANQVYYAVQVEDENGKNERCILLTQHELERAVARAKANPEDLTKKGFLQNMID